MVSHSTRAVRLSCLVILGVLWAANPSFADLVITVGNGDGQITPVPVSANSGGFIDFFVSASNDSPPNNDSFDLTGYNIAIDFGNDNFGFPTGFSNFSVAPIGGPGGQFNNDGAIALSTSDADSLNLFGQNPNFDFVVGDTNLANPNIVELAPPTGLFRLSFDIGNAPVGIYDVIFQVNPTNPASTSFTTSPANQVIVAQQGSVEISAVPEPSALALLFLVGGAMGVRRRRS